MKRQLQCLDSVTLMRASLAFSLPLVPDPLVMAPLEKGQLARTSSLAKVPIVAASSVVLKALLIAAFLAIALFDIAGSLNTRNSNVESMSNHRPKSKRRVEAGKDELEEAESTSKMVLKLLNFYNKEEPPMQDKGTEVKIGIYVISFHSINEQTMDYAVSMYLRQAWNDPRLDYSRFRIIHDKVRLGENKWNNIWIPDTFLRNEKHAVFHSVTVENRMLTLSRNGDIWYVTKVSATLSCPMRLESFPMDIQTCPMLFESFGYTMDVMYFKPLGDLNRTIQVDPELQMPQFAIKNRIMEDCSQNYTTGAYPCLEFRFVLQRDIGYFLIQVYVPSILIVILSWVSFWINVDASPARVSIGLLTVLTTTTMSGGARATLPRVSYIKAIDVWMIICLLFAFLSLIEYAVVNVLARHSGRGTPKPPRVPASSGAGGGGGGGFGMGGGASSSSKRDLELGTPLQPIGRRNKQSKALSCFKVIVAENRSRGTGAGISAGTSGGAPAPPADDGKRRARGVDKFSRKVFPISFGIFNIVYWVTYCEPFAAKNPVLS